VYGLALQGDGKLVAGGVFNRLAGSNRSRLGRVAMASTAAQSLTVSDGGTVLNWLRSGAGPEALWTIFEGSTDNGATYTTYGNGTRIDGGWRLVTALPKNQHLLLRARGIVPGGRFNGSSSLIESTASVLLGLPTITPATIPMGAIGSYYGVQFTATGGVGAVTLALSGLPPAGIGFNNGLLSGIPSDGGTFPLSIIATDSSCSCMSAIDVTLVVGVPTAPAFTTAPVSQTIQAGQTATFTVVATGVPDPALQWQVLANGGTTWTNLTNAAQYSGVTTSTLTITSAPSSLHGQQYRALASNTSGSTPSAAATLSVAGLPVFTTQPADRSVSPGQTAVFTAVASATVTPTYQWQISSNGGTSWSNVTNAAPHSGATTGSLSVTGV